MEERMPWAHDAEIRIGTSGWHYDHWIGRFYPEKLRKDKWLEYYAQHFDTVEINNTFYHLPREQTMVNWHDRVPTGFLFAVKASRYITHIKKLSDPGEALERFFDLANLLQEHLGPILYQLPPSLHKDLERLDAFIAALPHAGPRRLRVSPQELVRTGHVRSLERAGASPCAFTTWATRLRRGSSRAAGVRPLPRDQRPLRRQLSRPTCSSDWADWMKSQMGCVRAIYAYFNNDISGHALNNARTLKQILGVV